MRRWGLRFLGMALCVGWVGASVVSAADFWKDDFMGTAGTQPSGWEDESDNPAYNAEVAYSYTTSMAAITRTAEDVWGKVYVGTKTVDVSVYPKIEMVVNAVSGATWKAGIQEVGGGNVYRDLTTSVAATGTYVFEYAAIMGWSSGSHDFKIQVTVEGLAGAYVVLESVRIYDGLLPGSPTSTPTVNLNTQTSTLTPTATPTADPNSPTITPTGTRTSTITLTPAITSTFTITVTPITTNNWVEHFVPNGGTKPPNWEDDTNIPAYKAQLAYTGPQYSSWVQVLRTTSDTWGKVVSPARYCDLSRFSEVEIRAVSVSSRPNSYTAATAWKLGIQEIGGDSAYADCGSNSIEGVFSYNIADKMGWPKTGKRVVQFVIIVEGPPGAYVNFDSIRIYCNGVPAPEATPVPTTEAWRSTFTRVTGGRGAPNEKPDLWVDEGSDSGKNMYICYSHINGYAYLSRTAEANYGVVMAPSARVNVGNYNYIGITVTGLSANAKWKIGVQESSQGKAYVDAFPATNLIGSYVFEYPQAMAAANGITWTGVRDFNLMLIVEGPPASTVEFSGLNVFAYGPEFTPTITPTSTITPWVQERETLAYPNPASDKVTFAYLAEGNVTVNLDIFKLTGEKVAGVQQEQFGRPQEPLTTVWDAASVSSGIYFCHLRVMGHGGRVWVDVFKKVAIAK